MIAAHKGKPVAFQSETAYNSIENIAVIQSCSVDAASSGDGMLPSAHTGGAIETADNRKHRECGREESFKQNGVYVVEWE